MLKPLPTQTFTAPHEGLRVAPLRYLGAQGVHTARSAALMPPVSPLLCPRASRRHRLPPPWLSFISRLHPLAQAHLRLNLQIFFNVLPKQPLSGEPVPELGCLPFHCWWPCPVLWSSRLHSAPCPSLSAAARKLGSARVLTAAGPVAGACVLCRREEGNELENRGSEVWEPPPCWG